MANLSTLVPAPRILTPSPPNAGDQNNTFIDSSSNSFTITRNGNTTQGTFSPYGDNWSNYFDGNLDSLTVADNVAFDLSNGAFTLEVWVYLNGNNNFGLIVGQWGVGGNNAYGLRQAGTTFYPEFVYTTNGTTQLVALTGSTALPLNRWVHVAVVRNGSSTISLFVDGSRVATNSSFTATIFDSSANVRVGGEATGSNTNGYISNARLVKGTAVYDPTQTTLTVPTSPLTAITNTSLLTCQSNRFRDASTNNFAITSNGDVSVQRFSPFAPVAPYSAGTIGGSGYFDGSGDNLKVTSSLLQLGTSDFTLEFFAYFTSLGSGDIDFFRHDTSNQAFGIGIYNSGTDLRIIDFRSGSTVVNFGAKTQIRVNEWTHVAFSRSGNDFRCFLNGSISSSGVQVSSQNLTLTTTNTFRIMDGVGLKYINDYRLIIGTAQYTANFTPPTAPLTAITNTSLLLNFTNAGIRDDAMMSVPETVGNAQISTSVKKYGTGSLAFDGTSDYLVVNSAATDLYAFGSGAFTIEFWLYLNGTQTSNLIDFRPSGTEGAYPTIFVQSNVLKYFTSTGDRIIGSTLSNSVWYHIALCKSGTSTKLFIDGTQTGSTYTDTATYLGSAGRPYIGGSSRNVDTNIVNGYIDDLRVTKGVARYTTNFTPPQTSLPVDKDTVLLLDGDGTPNSGIQVDTYTTTGTVHTWTKPYGAKVVMINIRGAGGGGGGGQGGAANSIRLGGGGGGGGARVEQICTADCLPNTLYVIVGAGGTGGAGGNAAIGSAGGAGGNSYVAKNNTNPPVTGIVAFAGGGGGGSGGYQNSNCGGGGGGGSSGQGATSTGNATVAGGWPGYAIISTEANGGSGGSGPSNVSDRAIVEWGGGAGGSNQSLGSNSISRRGQHSLYGSGGGGPGVSIASNQVVQTVGGIGGNSGFYADIYSSTVGAQPGANGTNGSAGEAGASYLVTGNGGGGGGGGGVATASGGTGGTGGAGGLGGGGGGGGGGAGGVNTNGIGGTGGAGGNGVVEIITYF